MKTEQLILEKLDKIEKKLDHIEEHMIEDLTLTKEERSLLDESFKNEKNGKIISNTDLRKNLGL